MSEEVYGLSARAADRLEQLLNQSDGGSRPSRRASGSGRIQMVKCLSAVSAGSTGVLSECYPAQIISPAGDKLLPAETGGLVLLTVIGSDGNAAIPVADQTYLCIVAGDAVGDESGSGSARVAGRPRAFAVAGSAAAPSNWKDTVKLVAVAALPANTYANGSSGVGATLTASANGTLNSTAIIDGFNNFFVGDDILVAAEPSASRNGVYKITDLGSASTPWVLTRRSDMDQSSEFVNKIVPVWSGVAHPNTLWWCTNTSAPTMGSSSITFKRVSGNVNSTAATTTNNAVAAWDGTGANQIKNSNWLVSAFDLKYDQTLFSLPLASLNVGFTTSSLILNNQIFTGSPPTSQQTLAALSCGTTPTLQLTQSGTTVKVTNTSGEIWETTIDNGCHVLAFDSVSLTGLPRTPRYSVVRWLAPGTQRLDGIDTTFQVTQAGVTKNVAVAGGIIVGIS